MLFSYTLVFIAAFIVCSTALLVVGWLLPKKQVGILVVTLISCIHLLKCLRKQLIFDIQILSMQKPLHIDPARRIDWTAVDPIQFRPFKPIYYISMGWSNRN